MTAGYSVQYNLMDSEGSALGNFGQEPMIYHHRNSNPLIPLMNWQNVAQFFGNELLPLLEASPQSVINSTVQDVPSITSGLT